MRSFQVVIYLFLLLRCFIRYASRDNFRRFRFERCCDAIDIPTHVGQKSQLADIDGAGGVRRRFENIVMIMMQGKRQIIERSAKAISLGLDRNNTVARVFVATGEVFQCMRGMRVWLALGKLLLRSSSSAAF